MIAARVVNQQSKEKRHVTVAIDHRIKERAKSCDLTSGARNAAIYHVKDSGADDHQSGIRKQPAIVGGVSIAKKNGGDGVDDQSKKGEYIGGNSGKRKTAHNRIQQ